MNLDFNIIKIENYPTIIFFDKKTLVYTFCYGLSGGAIICGTDYEKTKKKYLEAMRLVCFYFN